MSGRSGEGMENFGSVESAGRRRRSYTPAPRHRGRLRADERGGPNTRSFHPIVGGGLMATAPPAFQLYARDWLMGTRELPPEARGVYIDLLCLAWDKDGLTTDQNAIVAYLAISPAKFRRIWPMISDKFVDAEDGRLRNPRQEQQRAELEGLRQKRAEAGQKGGLAKAQANGKPS